MQPTRNTCTGTRGRCVPGLTTPVLRSWLIGILAVLTLVTGHSQIGP